MGKDFVFLCICNTDVDYSAGERESSFLTAHQHIIGHSVPYSAGFLGNNIQCF